MRKRTKKILEEIKKTVKGINPEAEIILFGSRVRNEAREDSDWDFLILTPDQPTLKTEQNFRHRLLDLEIAFGESFSIFVYSISDWEKGKKVVPLFKNILEDGSRI